MSIIKHESDKNSEHKISNKTEKFKADSTPDSQNTPFPLGILCSPETTVGPLNDIGIQMHNGYIKLWRKLQKSAIFKDSCALHLFIWILTEAQHLNNVYSTGFKDGSLYLSKGQMVFGRFKASENTGMSPSTVRNALKRLSSKYGMISTISDNKRTIVTVCNWDTYQNSKSKQDNERTTKGQQEDTKQECKNERMKEKDHSKVSLSNNKSIKKAVATKGAHSIDSEANKLAVQDLVNGVLKDNSVRNPVGVAIYRANNK